MYSAYHSDDWIRDRSQTFCMMKRINPKKRNHQKLNSEIELKKREAETHKMTSAVECFAW